MMKLFAASLLVLFSIGYVQGESFEYSFTCVSGSDTDDAACTISGEGDDTAAATAAAKALAFCSGPENSVTDNAYATYGCNACAEDLSEDDGTCVACAAWDDTNSAAANNCNTYVAPTIGWNCWTSGAEEECTGTTISCFGASDAYITAEGDVEALLAGGCGACDSSYEADDCDACATEGCNSALRVASIMGPLLALLFWLH